MVNGIRFDIKLYILKGWRAEAISYFQHNRYFVCGMLCACAATAALDAHKIQYRDDVCYLQLLPFPGKLRHVHVFVEGAARNEIARGWSRWGEFLVRLIIIVKQIVRSADGNENWFRIQLTSHGPRMA